MSMDSGLIDPEYEIPSAVWSLKDQPALAVSLGDNRRWWCVAVIPGQGVQTNNQDMPGYSEMIRADKWLKTAGLCNQHFPTRREALQALAATLELYDPPN